MKFNFKAATKKVQNYEGAQAYALTPQTELYTMVATSMLNEQFYEKAERRLARLRTLITQNDPSFVARLAIYAREQMYMRSMPLVLTVELGMAHRGDSKVSKMASRVIQRADEITELLAYYQLANERKEKKKLNRLSKQLQKGLADAFNKFDEYQFAKYNKDTQIKLKDALFLVHPKAKDQQQQQLFNAIAKDQLKTPYTWEVQLSAMGQEKYASDKLRKQAFKAGWEELIFSNKMGYMATIRNLRNILEAEVSNEALEKVCKYLSNAEAVASSKQLPFRFLSAYRELQNVATGRVGMVLDALEAAAIHSSNNIPGYDISARVVIAADVSGSMEKAISVKSTIHNYDIGLLLAMLLQRKCKNVITGIFGDKWKAVAMPTGNVLANVMKLRQIANQVGYSTNGYLVIQELLKKGQVVDKVMFFTDCQMWNSNHDGKELMKEWTAYKKIAPDAKLYLFDLAGYGNTPLDVQSNDVYLIAGWSDKIFHALSAIEEGGDAVKMINSIPL